MALGGPAGTRRWGPNRRLLPPSRWRRPNRNIVRSDAPTTAAADSPPTETDTETGLPDGETESVGIAIGSGPVSVGGDRRVRRPCRATEAARTSSSWSSDPARGTLETTEDGLGVAILEAAIRDRWAGATAKAPGPQEAGAARAESDVTGTIAVLTRPNQSGDERP